MFIVSTVMPFDINPNNCLVGATTSKCWFDLWSIQHMYYPALDLSLVLTELSKLELKRNTEN